MIYALVNSKGGVSKTTTAVHLATMLARETSTLLIDGDPQASAATWAYWRRECNVEQPSPVTTRLLGRALLDEGRSLSKGFDNTVVDAGGRDSADLRAALSLADVAIIPVGASNFDSAAMSGFLEVVEMAKDFNPNLSIRVLLARIDARTKDAGEMLDWLEKRELPLLTSKICERVAFRRVLPLGLSVHEHKKDNVAIEEMEKFFEEVTA
jgi:chromosome partitioning protein